MKKSYPRISAHLFAMPWAILESTYDSICEQFIAHCEGRMPANFPANCDEAAANDGVGPKWRDRQTGEEGYWHPQVEVAGGLALVPVHGILGKNLSTLDMMCGGYDVGLLQQQLENITEDPSISTVVLDFQSPGGIVLGINTTADAIVACRAAGKTVIAYTSECCASAAYWLAAACDQIHAEQSAIVGSISIISRALDNSGEWAQKGWKAEIFTTGKFKAMGAPGKPWTDEERALVKDRQNLIDADFKGFIKAQRGLTDDQMQGQWWHAAHAPAQLVDSTAFPSLQALLETLLTPASSS